MTYKYNFYSDAAHGWLRVLSQEIADLGLVDAISPYSYFSPNGKYIYLEEDSDATKFIDAYTLKYNEVPEFNYKYSERSAIRNYPGYYADYMIRFSDRA